MDKVRQSIATSFLSLPHIYYMCSLPMKLAPKQDGTKHENEKWSKF